MGLFYSSLSGNVLQKKIQVKDYLLSQETFDLFHDKDWDMMITLPVPENLPDYYQTQAYQPHQSNRKSFFDKIYRWVRNRSFYYKYRLIKKQHPAFRSVLDFGTATGDFLTFLQTKNIDVCGIEPNDKALEIAQKSIPGKVFKQLDACDKKFDVITLWHVLEHVDNPGKLLQQLTTKLHPEGLLFIAVPNFKSYDAEFYRQYWAAYDVPRHLWHFSPRSIHQLFEAYGLQLIDQKPLYLDSFYVSLLSEQYKTGKKKWFSAFVTGLRSNIKAHKSGNYSSLIYIAVPRKKNKAAH
jgi:2-polyprenyl-3-methyl-5-hydroxy-6-metoxy-1,4-benzoquinol methylase